MFNTTKKEIESKKFNIFIGISLGNKWFTKEHLREYLNWALDYTKDRVLFLIADNIQAINYNARNKQSMESALKKAIKEGDRIGLIIKELILELSKEQQNKVEILRWEEYEQCDNFYKKYILRIHNKFEKDLKFKEEILKLVRNSIKDKVFSSEDYLSLSNYLLEEFISIYSGISYCQNYYGLYIYPQDTLIPYFIKKVHHGNLFPELNEKLPKEKVALAVMN